MFARSSSFPLRSILLLTALAHVTGCNEDKPEPQPATTPTPTPAPSPAPAAKSPHGAHGAAPSAPGAAAPAVAIKWTAPEGWKEMPPRPMRKATYQIEGDAGPAEVAVFYFGPGQGGGVDANISRWVGQFQGLEAGSEKREEREVNGLKLHSVSVEKGTFGGGMPGMPGAGSSKEDWGMHATIVQAKSGQYFFKLTGPSKTVAAQKSAFNKMLDGITEG